MNRLPSALRRRPCRGVSLIEVIVLLLVVALWLLSTAGLVANSLKIQTSAGARMAAIAAATELGEMMEANLPGARAGGYIASITTTPTSAATDCAANFCPALQLAAYDLSQWTTRLVGALPLQSAVVAVASGTALTTYTITINWTEPRGRQAYGDAGTTETATFTMTKVLRNG